MVIYFLHFAQASSKRVSVSEKGNKWKVMGLGKMVGTRLGFQGIQGMAVALPMEMWAVPFYNL